MKNKSTILNVLCYTSRTFLCFFFSLLFIQFSAQTPYKSIQKAEVLPQSLQLVKRINHTQKIDAKNKGQLDQSSDISASSDDGISPLQKMAGKPEDLSKRDAFSKTFQNADGSYTAVIGAGPIHYEKNGKWEDIDTKISKSSIGNYAYSNVANMMESYFGFTSQQGVMSKTKEGEVKEFLNTKMYWEVNGQKVGEILGANVAAQVENDKLFYNNLFGNISAEFTVLTAKRKLNYIIPNKEALGVIPGNAEYLVFSEDLFLPKGWTSTINEKGDLEIRNIQNKTTFIYAKPTVLEKYGTEELSLPNRDTAEFKVEQNGQYLTYVLKVKTSWLLDESRIYPLAIDPTVYPNINTYWTGSVDQLGFGNDDILYVGRDGGAEVDGWVRFNLSSIPDNQTISSVTSGLYFFGSTGTINNLRTITIGDNTVDPLSATYYIDIFNGYTQNISLTTSIANNNVGFRYNTFTDQGIAYIQNSLPNDFATILVWPSGTWGATNYAAFRGYSSPDRPYLTINYYATPTCLIPSSSSGTYFISNVTFKPSLIAQTTSGTTGYAATGYSNSATNMATQIPGGVINVEVSNNAVSNFTKAWVDWNQNGIFDSTEKVYDSGGILASNLIFGFVIPAGTVPGSYKIRIRNFQNSPYYLACGGLANGETEDYTFTVIADCAAKITSVSVPQTCGAGPVSLTATGVSAASYQWYSSEFGSSAIAGATGAAYTTPSLAVGTYTYYVTAKSSGGCESVYRTPVKVVVSPLPVIQFTQTSPEICGSVSSLSVSSSGDKEEVTLFSDSFNTMNNFDNIVAGNNNVNAYWQVRPSPYVPTSPPYNVNKPALSSGFTGGNFVMMNTDVRQNTNIMNRLQMKNNLNSTGYQNLKVDFDIYYFSMVDNNTTQGYVLVEYSINGGGAWTTLSTYLTDQGSSPSRWDTKTIVLPAAVLNQTQLKLRFTTMAFGGTSGSSTLWVGNIVAIDNLRIYGDKPLSTTFNWAGSNVSIFNADCTTPYSGASTTVCVKPTSTELENNAIFTVNATATLSNGCSAVGTFTVPNNSKTWDTASTDWNATNWKPTNTLPTNDKCVIIKTPVNIAASNMGVAKNITIKSGGKLEIAGNLTVEEKVVNENTGTGAADQFVLLSSTENSNANYLQNSNTPNTSADGVMRAERRVTDMDNVLSGTNAQMDYVYWSAPVAGQDLQAFSPGTPANRIYQYNEPTDLFVKATGNFVPAKGYAIRAETGKPDTPLPSYDKTYNFRGIANNGDIPISIQRTNSSGTTGIGYNLVGNPYPSNIDFDELYYGNSSLIYNTAWFWTNNSYEEHQQGSSYGGNNYAVYNGTGGNAPTTPSGQPAYPDGIIKVGQGFIVQKKTVGSGSLEFKNSYGSGHNLRVTSDGTFFHKGNTPKNRFWIKLIAPEGLVNTQLIGYIPGATDGYEQDFDAEAMSLSSDLFYSVLDDKKLVIQGKSVNFNIEDKIPIGANIFKDGNYTIALDKAEGIFETDQNIYLKDNLLETVTNLSEQDYTFDATAGITEGRFEIIYQPENVLATGTADKDALEVYRDGGDFTVRSSHKRIAALEVYDASGRMVYSTNPFRKETVIPGDLLVNGIYLVKTELEDGQRSVKKIRK